MPLRRDCSLRVMLQELVLEDFPNSVIALSSNLTCSSLSSRLEGIVEGDDEDWQQRALIVDYKVEEVL